MTFKMNIMKTCTRGENMPYVKCHECQNDVHFRPLNAKEFIEKYVEGNEPIYCFSCFTKRYPKEEDKQKK